MAGFNFSQAVGDGVAFSWRHRAQIAPHAFWPLMLKISIFIVLTLTGLENNILRQGLILIPSFILEGLLVAYVVRFALLGEAQPLMLARHSGDTAEMIAQKRAVFASMLIYVLLKLLATFFAGAVLYAGMTPQAAGADAAAGGSPARFFAALVMAGAMLWGFRLLWLYIPVAFDYPIGLFLKKIEGFKISFNMIALWILCSIPVMVVIILFLQILMVVFPSPAEGVLSIPASIILAVVKAFVEIAIAVVANVSMAFGLREAISGQKK